MNKRKMKTFIICAVLLFSLVLSGYTFVMQPVGWDAVEVCPVYENGIRVTDGYVIGETIYTPMNGFIEMLNKDINIAWDNETKTAAATAEGLDFSATVGQQYMVSNGRYLYVPQGVMEYNGSVVVPIVEIAKVFNVGTTWDEENRTISVDTNSIEYLLSGDKFYNADDLYWFSRLISAEAGDQPMEGMIGVGNVVLNRTADPAYPDTIQGVAFDNKFGVQFSVSSNGMIYANPLDCAVVAAKLALEGYNTVGNAIYFVNPVIGAGGWFAQTRTFITAIGEHYFYS